MSARLSVLHAGVNEDVLDIRPIEINSFRLSGRRAVAVGRPTADQWEATMAFAVAVGHGSPYWRGDLVNYAVGRPDWRDKLDQMMSVFGLAEGTLHNEGWVARHVGPEARALAPSAAHAQEVASLDPGEQREWLDKAQTEGWTRRELRQALKTASRRKVLDGRADTSYTVDVTVQVEVQAQNATQAEDAAWRRVNLETEGVVISAKARPR